MVVMMLVPTLQIATLFIHVQAKHLDAVCDYSGRCVWNGVGWYRGCQDNTPFLSFDLFDSDGLLDLRCSAVQVVSIEITALRCRDMNKHVITDNDVTFYLGESKTECVSNLLCSSEIGGGGLV